MDVKGKFIVGTSGFSFDDWAGPFYPPGTARGRMFDEYVKHFRMVELNFTYYSMPGVRTFESLLKRSGEGFEFWVKVNKQVSHEGKVEAAEPFLAAVEPLSEAGKLAGLILQFPQSFRRTADNRRYLGAAVDALAGPRLAVEFRDRSWEHPSALAGLRERNVTLVVPDAPPIRGLFRPAPTATSSIGYLRLHSRDADKWYAGAAERYDYNYSDDELRRIALAWLPVAAGTERVYAMFNNCHRGQAARNAEAFARILDQIP